MNPAEAPAPGRVRLLWLDLDLEPAAQDACALALDLEAHARAARLLAETPRRRWIAAQGQLRRVLARLRRERPEALDLQRGPWGKPWVPGGPHFSLSHCGPAALLALRSDADVGVDLEQDRGVPEALELARRHFHPREARLLTSLEPPARGRAFLRLWTGKEAWLKAQGLGLASSPRGLTHAVFGFRQKALRLRRVPPAWPGLGVAELPVPEGWFACLASERPWALCEASQLGPTMKL